MMEVSEVVYDPGSFGVTCKSLSILKAALADSVSKRIAVVEVPASHCSCGFYIFEKESGKATWTGDGFRHDGRGEGGAGYYSARQLLKQYFICPVFGEAVSIRDIYVELREGTGQPMFDFAKQIATYLRDSDFAVLQVNSTR